jgi:trigger factor
LTVEIIEVNGCKRNLAVEVPAQEVDQEIDKLARDYARNAKVPGFRPGKVPINIVRQRFGSDLLQEAVQKIIQRYWKDAVDEHKLRPLAPPSIKDLNNKPGEPLKFTAAFEVLPSLEVKDYKGVDVKLTVSEVTDENVNQAIENLREQHAQFVPVDGEARDGLYLTVTVDGKFEDNSQPIHEEDITLVIGSPQTDAEFSKNLRGGRAGETRVFEVNYPEDHQRKLFAGKKILYSVMIKDIKEKQLAEPNDDFAKDLGSEGIDALRTKVRDELVTQAKENAEKKAREALLDSIVERHTIDVPDCMVQEELEAYARRIANNLAYQGVDINKASIDWTKVFEEERPRSERSVRRAILLDAIARQEDLQVTDEEMDSELQILAKGTNKSAAALKAQLEKEERIQSLREHLRQNKALDFIYRNANIS